MKDSDIVEETAYLLGMPSFRVNDKANFEKARRLVEQAEEILSECKDPRANRLSTDTKNIIEALNKLSE